MIAQDELRLYAKNGLFWIKRKNTFRKSQQIAFIEQLNSYLISGRGLVESLESVGNQYREVYGKNHIAVQIADRLRHTVVVGQGFEELLQKYFNPVIGLGFELAKNVSGDKSNVLNIVELLKVESAMIRNIFMALAIPLFFLVFGVATQVLVGSYIIPMISQNPPDTLEINLALKLTDVIVGYWPALIVVVSGLLWLFTTGKKKWRPDGAFGGDRKTIEDYLGDNAVTNKLTDGLGAAKAKIDTVWPFSLFREFWSVRILRLIGYMKLAGIEDLDALKIIKGYCPPAIQFFVEQMITGTGIGSAKSDYFAKGLISPALMVRLHGYFENVDNTTFAKGLVEVSNQAEKDIALQSQSSITRLWIILFSTGFFLVMLSMSAVIQIFSKSFL